MVWSRRYLLTCLAATGLAACADSNNVAARTGGKSAAQSIDIASAPIGKGEVEAVAWLESRRIRGGRAFGRYRIYETPVFEQVFDRQRLVLAFDDDALSQVFVIVDPAFPDDAERSFSDVFKVLLGAYGRPVISRQRGRFSPKIAVDLNTGAFRREHEWRVPGGHLRLGIPRRTDRAVRIEVHFARRLRITTRSDWSVEAIR